MDINHIFIFTDTNGKIVDELISFGLKANDSHVHQGQGTTNHTFSFENFFLEIVWVHNEQEIKSDLVRPTGLWQRAEFFKNNFSPFGLIIENNEGSDHLFVNANKYQPEYFPDGMTFDILQNALQPDLPWMGRLPFKREKNAEKAIVNHNNRLKSLTKSTFQYCGIGNKNFLDNFKDEKTIQFIKSNEIWLTLTFDNFIQGLERTFEKLHLTIEY